MSSVTRPLPHHHDERSETIFIQEQITRVQHFQAVSELFKQLGDVTRIRIFWLLCHCEECIINLSALLNMSSPAISHHLRPLKAGGLIVSRRVKKEVYYRASDAPQSRLLHQMIEMVMQIACPDAPPLHHETIDPLAVSSSEAYHPDQIALVHRVHEELMHHLDQRITIEELAKRYLLNPTTLKAAFKAVYGNSLAAHIREHRMEQAALLLRQTDQSIAHIARTVGYDSQSKFTAAFKGYFHVLPSAYRKTHDASRDGGQKNGGVPIDFPQEK